MCRQSCGLPLGGDDSSLSWISAFCLDVPSLSLSSCWLCPTCCCPAGSAKQWGPLGQCLTPPVVPCSQGLSPGSLQGASQVLHEWLKTCLCCVGAFLAVTCGWKVSGARWKPPSQEKWEPLSDPRPQHRQLCSSLASPCQGLTL